MKNKQFIIHRKLNASSIAEVVIALSIIALCFGVAALVFIRSLNVTTRFQDIRNQTEIQSEIMRSQLRDNDSVPLIEKDFVIVETIADEKSDSCKVVLFKGSDDRIIWQQQIIKKK